MSSRSHRARPRATTLLLFLALVVGTLAVGSPTLIAPSASAAAPPDTLIDPSATWAYLEDDSDPNRGGSEPLAWTENGFDTTGWTTGTGSFGAKNGVIGDLGGGFTPDTLLNHYVDGAAAPTVRTYFFRTTFTLEPGVREQIIAMTGQIAYDDGVRIFLNGTKVAGFDDSAVPAETPRMYAGSNASAPKTGSFTVPGEALVDGTNTIAVALYQSTSGSSDVYLDLSSLVPQAAPTRVVLTPSDATATSQHVSWLAARESDTTGAVQFRRSGTTAVRTVDGYSVGAAVGNDKPHFSARLTNLTPGTAYDFRVGNSEGWTGWSTFTTADPAREDWQFLYYGDAQLDLDSTWPDVVSQAEARAPGALGSVHAGDLINNADNDLQWTNWFAGMGSAAVNKNVFAAPGNHEAVSDGQLTTWKAHFEYPLNNPTRENIGALAARAEGTSEVARQYAAYYDHWADNARETIYYSDYQNVRFITLNASGMSWNPALLTPPAGSVPACSGAECPGSSTANLDNIWKEFQAAWLDQVLQSSPARWNVVTFHQPVFAAAEGRSEPALTRWWVPVFEDNDVDLVLMGHDHVYARGYHADDATETPGLWTGPAYVVSTSSSRYYDLDTNEESNNWVDNGAVRRRTAEQVATYGVLDVSDDTLRYRSYIGHKGAAPSTDQPVGSLFDEFTVHKDGDGKYVAEAGIEIPTELTFLSEPEDAAVLAGDAATLRATASTFGGRDIAYQWQSAAAGTETWTDVAGATGYELTLPPAETGQSGTRYRVLATSGPDTITSSAATVTVTDAPTGLTLVTQPEDVEAVEGEAATFRAAAYANGAVTYRWEVAAAGSDTWSDVPGVGDDELVVPDVAPGDSGARYRVVVGSGGEEATSAPASLTVLARRVSFTSQPPATVRATAGRDAVLRAAASATPIAPVGYQWQRRSGTRWVDLPGQGDRTLVLSSVTAREDGARFRVVASSGSASAASTAVLLRVSQQSTRVTGWAKAMRAGRKPVIKAVASQPGRLVVDVTTGGYHSSRSVRVGSNAQRILLRRALPRSARGRKVTVSLRLVPSAGSVYAPTTSRFTARVRARH